MNDPLDKDEPQEEDRIGLRIEHVLALCVLVFLAAVAWNCRHTIAGWFK